MYALDVASLWPAGHLPREGGEIKHVIHFACTMIA
jgi:hypothetical protein